MKWSFGEEEFYKRLNTEENVVFLMYGAVDYHTGLSFIKKNNKVICSLFLNSPSYTELVRSIYPLKSVPDTYNEFLNFGSDVLRDFKQNSKQTGFLIDLWP